MVPFEGNNSKQKTVVAITKTANPAAMFANCYSVANGNKTSTTGSPHRGGNEVMKHNVGGSIDSESLSSSSSFDCEALGAELISTMMEGNIDGEFMEGTSDEQEEMLEGVLAMQRVSEAESHNFGGSADWPCTSTSSSSQIPPWESPNDVGDDESMECVSNLIEIQGICHIDLLGAHFVITHNEQTNDFFVDLVQSGGGDQCVLQTIFRFPEHHNDICEIFTSSYGKWTTSGRVVYHHDGDEKEEEEDDDDSTTASPPVMPHNHCRGCCRPISHGPVANAQGPLPCFHDGLATRYAEEGGRRLLTPSSAFQKHLRQQHWHFKLHVYELFYAIELNGRMIERLEHRLAFHKVLKC